MRKICLNFDCTVYIFGGASDICPECKTSGKVLSEEQNTEFIELYRQIQWS